MYVHAVFEADKIWGMTIFPNVSKEMAAEIAGFVTKNYAASLSGPNPFEDLPQLSVEHFNELDHFNNLEIEPKDLYTLFPNAHLITVEYDGIEIGILDRDPKDYLYHKGLEILEGLWEKLDGEVDLFEAPIHRPWFNNGFMTYSASTAMEAAQIAIRHLTEVKNELPKYLKSSYHFIFSVKVDCDPDGDKHVYNVFANVMMIEK